MRVPGAHGRRRWIAAIAVAAGLTLAGAVSAPHALAAGSAITGVVEDTSGAPQAGVTVNVLDPTTDATDATTTTASDGTFTASVASGTYNVEFIPQSSTGLQSYLATGVTTGSAPLTIILKTAVVVQVQGTLKDSQGNVYPSSNGFGAVTFTSPLNHGSEVDTDSSGKYSAAVLADQNFTASARAYSPGDAAYMNFSGLPVGTLDTSQTYDLTLPTARLTVSLRDASGAPITGGKFNYNGSISPLPGLPGTSASAAGIDATLDSNGDVTVPVPNGITLTGTQITLNNGLIIPVTVPVMNGNQSVTVTAPAFVQVQGTLKDSQGNVYPSSNGFGAVTFTSPLNHGSEVDTDSSGKYSAAVLADQNFTASARAYSPGDAAYMNFSGLPVGTLDTSQTYDLTLPTARLTVSLRDASGAPITGGKFNYNGSISPLPGLPGTSASAAGIDATLDSNGDVTVPVPNGITLTGTQITLNNGLIIPVTVPVMNGNQSVTVTAPAFVQVQGTLKDSQGNVYPSSNGFGAVTFTSPLNHGSEVDTDSSGKYSAAVLADQNFTASARAYSPGDAAYMNFSGLPVGTLDTSQTYDLTLPTARLTVSLRDASGAPITGGKFNYNGSISPLPGLPGTSASAAGIDATLDSNGDVTVPVPNGITLTGTQITLNNGLIITFQLHPVTGDRHAYIIFNATTGQVIVDDQPPVVKGTPDTSPNAAGWYNAPVTITWTSTDPAPSSGTPTTPPPTTLSADGANQTATSAKSCDPAGNCATGTVTGINIDTTPPSVSVTGVTSGGTYSTAPSPACTTTDALSGVATSATVSVTNSRTSYTAMCSGATDSAGNTAAPASVTYQVIPPGYTTASLADSNGNPIAGAAVTFRSAGGSVTNATTGSDGIASATLTPGTYSVTMNYATGYQTKTIAVTAGGPNTVSFATVAVTAQVNDPSSADIAAASVAHAGNTGTYGPKTPVDSTGAVTFQVLPGTNTFTAYDAGGYQAQTVTITGTATVTFATVAVTVQINDPSSADIAAASATHAGNTGTSGPKTPVDATGAVTFQVLPGTSTFTAYDADGYQAQTVTISGAATVTFATVAVTVTVLKNGSPLTTATVTHAGNTGTYGPKTAVDGNGEVVFQVLPGTNSFTAWDGTAYQSETLTVTGAASTSITVA